MSVETIKVLSIEDDSGYARLIQAMLHKARSLAWDLPRFEVAWVQTLAEGLAWLDQRDVDVVLSDLDLPDSRAGDTFAAVHAHVPDLPIVVLTGREDQELARQTVRAGAEDYLFKREMSGPLLAHALIYAIERQQTKQALQRTHDELERRVKERTAELEQANVRLRREVAERAQTEQALRESERRYRNVVEDQTEMICRFLSDGTLTFVNDAFCKSAGLSRDELLGTKFLAGISAENQELVKEKLASLSPENPVITYDIQVTKPDGEARWEQWTDRALYDEQKDLVEYQSVGRDITERVRAEDRLGQSHANLTALVENIDDYVLLSDRNARPVLFNSAYARIMENALGIEMKPGLQPHKLLADKEMVAWWDELHRRVLSGEKFRVEYAHEFEPGNVQYLEVSYHPVIKDGDVIGFSEFTRDITERKQIEFQREAALEALRESERRYRELFENSKERLALIERAKQEWENTVDSLPQLVCLLDSQKRVLRANRIVETWELAQVAEVEGLGVHQLFHPDCADPACYLSVFLRQAWKELAQGQPAECQIEDRLLGRHLHIQVRPLSTQTSRRPKGAGSFAAVVAHDISERVQLESQRASALGALRESEARFQTLVDSMDDIICPP